MTHRKSRTAEYYIWQAMKRRCYNANSTSYAYYGGRGITVCDRWRKSFENFLADMGERPSSVHMIERKNNNEPYSPENCVWATRSEQMRNRRPMPRSCNCGVCLRCRNREAVARYKQKRSA